MIRLWDLRTDDFIGQPLLGHTDYITSMTLSSNESQIVSCSRDETIRVWDLKTAPFYSMKEGLNAKVNVRMGGMAGPGN
jgi:WD40 repeat protein